MKKEIRIPSNVAYLKEVESFIQSLLTESNIKMPQHGFISLGICESVNNAIYHGNKQDINKWVTITADFKDECLFIEVADEGKGFNYDDIPDPTSSENIKSEGGRGLYIIKHLADKMSFKNNGSVIELKFNLNREHQFLF